MACCSFCCHLKQHYGNDADLLHTFWPTLYLFKNTTSQPHTNSSDNNPSLLLNFGDNAWLVLPKLGYKVQLHPLDVAIFALSDHEHYSLIDKNSTDSKRWAVGGFTFSTGNWLPSLWQSARLVLWQPWQEKKVFPLQQTYLSRASKLGSTC